MKRIISAIVASALIILSLPAYADMDAYAAEAVSNTVSGYVSSTEGDIEIASQDKTPNIYVDANDYAGVVRVAGDLQSDIEAVTGVKANIVNDAADADIIIGTIGKSSAVDALIAEGSLDASEIENEWEAFTLQNVDGDLVIAGADKRGTIYGVYDLSEKMGVSPWEWWADVAPSHSDAVYVSLPDGGYIEGAPSVKYRGIFINQEYNLNRWSLSQDPDGGYMNTATYERIFELLLRLKANYMWPAMHEYSPAFNNDPENAKKADEYGIVMGSSHCEMLLRNNMGELLDFQERWIAEYTEKHGEAPALYMYHDGSLDADVAYDYTDVDAEGDPVLNKQFVEDYWRERVRENGSYENVYTIGMRGVHDGTWDPVNADTNEEKTALLEEIIAKQRQILSEELDKPADQIPQVFIPYKEIADLYNAGLEVPDDVTIMFTNDNYGHIRQGFNETERARSGGGGIYYHVSYHGRPSDLLWNGSTQLGLIKEEMTKAYDSGADTIWLLNVGPLKPFENQMEYFLDLGRNIDELRNTSIRDYVADNAQRYFGFDDAQAYEYADIQCERLELVNGRRPEFYQQGLFSLTSYGDEGQKVIDKYSELLERSEALYNSLPEEKRAGYYELQHYAVKSAYHIAMNYINADRSVLYKEQGRGAAANKYAELSAAHGRSAIEADIAEYNSIENGKWTGIIDPFVTKGALNASWNFPIAAAESETVSELPYTEMSIAVEDQQDIGTAPALTFSGYTRDVRFIDIFNKGAGSFDWKVSADADWIIFNKESGTVHDDDRIYAGIDWERAPEGESTANIAVTRYIGETAVQSKIIAVTLNNDVEELPEKTYAEANGYVSIEAEHYSRSTASGSYEWREQDDLGRSGTSMKFMPNAAESISDNSAYLEYDVYFESAGTFNVDVYRIPTLNERGSVNFGIGIDGSTPAVLEGYNRYYNNSNGTDRWGSSILNNNETLSAAVTVAEPGIHTIKLYGIDPGAVVDKIVVTTGTKYESYYGAPESYNTTCNNAADIMPEASAASSGITGDVTALFEPKLYTAGISTGDGSGVVTGSETKLVTDREGVGIIAVYNNDGTLSSVQFSEDYSDGAFVFERPVEPAQGQTVKGMVWSSIESMEPVGEAYGAAVGSGVAEADIIKLADVSSALITAAAYDGSGAMLGSKTVTGDFSEAEINEKVTVPIGFELPEDTAEVQIIVYDGAETLNALSPAYTVNTGSISLMAAYDEGTVELKNDLSLYTGREAVCMITNDEDGSIAYIRQETAESGTFKKITTGALDGTYSINIGVAGEGVVITEKAYTAVIITPDNPEETETLYSWDFSDESQTAQEGTNVPVISGSASYDSVNEAVRMSQTSSGYMDITFEEPVKTAQGQEITVVSKIAYGKNSGRHMDYMITDSAGNELFGSVINMYSQDGSQSMRIGGEEKQGTGLPPGLAVPNSSDKALDNGYTTFTVVLSPDTDTITLTVSNEAGESTTYTGSFPEGTSYDVAKLSFSTNYNTASRSCYVDDISVSKTTPESYDIRFVPVNGSGEAINGASVTVTDDVYGTVIAPESDGSYHLCDGFYTYTVTADGYATATDELELNPAAPGTEITVVMEGSGPDEPDPSGGTAQITIQYLDEENNRIKDDVVFTEEYEEGGTYTVPDELKKDFTIVNEDGKYDLYIINEDRSQLSAPYAESMTLRLEFNNSGQYDYYEDFENYTFDAGTWHAQSGNPLVPSAETDASKYIKYTAGSSTTGGYISFGDIDTDRKTVHISADVKFTPPGEPASGEKGISQFAISNVLPSFRQNNLNYLLTPDGSAGHIIVFEYNGESGTLTVNGTALDSEFIGGWMHLEADVNFSDKSVTMTVKNDSGLSAVIDDSAIYSSSFEGDIGSYYIRAGGPNGAVSADNITVKVTGDGGDVIPDIESVINNKSVYAFGDSIVYGHRTPEKSFMRLIENDYAIKLDMMAVNGATVMPGSNSIITQVNNAPDEAPDIVVFDGYTNDAYGSPSEDSFNSGGSHIDITACYGEITPEGTTEFDTNTFCGAFEELVYTMKQKWPESKLVFVTIHKSGARDFEIQSKLRGLTMEICEKWGVTVVDMFSSELDTTDPEQMEKYMINGAGSHPNEEACRAFYIPAVVETLESLYSEATGPTEDPGEEPPVSSDYDNTAGSWRFDFGADEAEGYIGVSAGKSYTDGLDYGFIGIKEEDCKLSSGEYMDGFRMLEGQVIELENGSGANAEAPNNDFVAVTDPQEPIRFTMSVENGGWYTVKVTLANASQTEPAYVTLMTERRHQLLTNAEIPAGGTLEYEFSVDVETYYWKALNGQYKDDTLSVEVAGTNAAIASMEVTKAAENGTTVWIITDSTGCDQPTNFPYVNINSLAGVGQGLTKYLPADIALSNQGDGGLASNDTNHYSCAKAGFKPGDYLYVEYGHNETSIERYTENLQRYYDDCHAAGVKMIVVGPIDRCQTSQFDAASGTWSPSGLPNYSAAGKAFVEEKLAANAEDIAFVDLNARWIEFLNGTTQRVSDIRGEDIYEANSAYYYYRLKASGIDTTHINEAGADVAAYIFFTEAKKIVEEGGAQAEVLRPLVEGMRNNEPYIVPDEIIAAGPVGENSYYPESPMQVYEGYEAEIRGTEFNGNELLSVTANVEYYTGLDAKNIPYAVAAADMLNSEGEIEATYYSNTDTKYDATNGRGTFKFEFDGGAVMPEGGSYRIYLQGFTSGNEVMEGEDYRISEYFTPETASNMYMIGDKEDISIPDTFDYYGVRKGADLGGNNGWYLAGSSSRTASLEKDGDGTAYAQLTKTDEKDGSYYLYRSFDSAVRSGKLIFETDLYYENGNVTFKFTNRTDKVTQSGAFTQQINAFKIDGGALLDSGGNSIGEFPANEWVHVTYVLDMDRGEQELTVGDDIYTYKAEGMDSIIPGNVTVFALQQLNLVGDRSETLSARLRNTAVRTMSNDDLLSPALTLVEPVPEEGFVSIEGSGELTVSAAMNTIVTVSAVPNDGYLFEGWYEESTGEFISGDTRMQIRLSRDVTLTARFVPDDDPIEYAYRESFTALSTGTLAENGWTSSAQDKLEVKNDTDSWEDGNYIYFNPSSSKEHSMSGAFTLDGQLDGKYVIEMNFGISNGSGNSGENSELTLTTAGTGSEQAEYLIKLTAAEKSGGSKETSMSWYINGDTENTVMLEQSGNNPVWAHMTLTVDPETGTAELVITQNGGEKYRGTVGTGASSGDCSVTGLSFRAGRMYSKCQLDNIRVYTADQV